jgi:DNA-binding Lrp family transcriptional regulator
MDTNAYVLLSVEPQRTDEVVRRLSAIPRALVRQVLGPYDIVVELSEDSVVDVTSVVRSKIRPVPGVTQTVTCVWLGASDQSGGE